MYNFHNDAMLISTPDSRFAVKFGGSVITTYRQRNFRSSEFFYL
jgi:hypothetical protein